MPDPAHDDAAALVEAVLARPECRTALQAVATRTIAIVKEAVADGTLVPLEDALSPERRVIECAATLVAGWVVGEVCASYHPEMRDGALAR